MSKLRCNILKKNEERIYKGFVFNVQMLEKSGQKFIKKITWKILLQI